MNGPDFQYDGLTAFAPITSIATDKKKGLMSAADKAKLDSLSVSGGGGAGFTTPVASDFAWSNQGSATLDSSHSSLALAIAPQAGDSLHLLTRPWTAGASKVTAYLDYLGFGIPGDRGGLVFYDSVSGKLQTHGTAKGTGVDGENWNSFTSFAASNYDQVVPVWPHWWRLTESGGTRTVEISHDGEIWLTIYAVPTGTFLTPDRVGIFVTCNTAGGATKGVTVIARSWA